MEQIELRAGDGNAFRHAAAALLARGIGPQQVDWRRLPALEGGLVPPPEHDAQAALSRAAATLIPRSFMRVSRLVSLHRDLAAPALLYGLLWRRVHERRAMPSADDGAVALALTHMSAAVARDIRWAEQGLRFEAVGDADEPVTCAWVRPHHFILPALATWMAARHGSAWLLATPDHSILRLPASMRFAAAMADRPDSDAWARALCALRAERDGPPPA